MQGKLSFHVDLGPLATLAWHGDNFPGTASSASAVQFRRERAEPARNSAMSLQALKIQQRLKKVLKGSRALDEESLCVVAGEKCWDLSVSVRVLQHDGGLEDACVLAALLALLTFRKEQEGNFAKLDAAGLDDGEAKELESLIGVGADSSKEEATTHADSGGDVVSSTSDENTSESSSESPEESEGAHAEAGAKKRHREEQMVAADAGADAGDPAPLSVHHLPIPCTFSFFGPMQHVVDPCAAEERAATGSLTLCGNQYGELCLVEALGTGFTMEQLVGAELSAEIQHDGEDGHNNSDGDREELAALGRTMDGNGGAYRGGAGGQTGGFVAVAKRRAALCVRLLETAVRRFERERNLLRTKRRKITDMPAAFRYSERELLKEAGEDEK